MFAPKLIDRALRKYLPTKGVLAKAMRYSVFAGGKRFRPILMIEAARACGGNINKVMPAACAMETIHTFTLIHDDLPAMDDSNLRRGKPTSHKVFGEDIAILAGDALNTLAFKILADRCPEASGELAEGLLKVVEGQVLDLRSEGKKIGFAQLQKIHLLKTAALIESSVRMGAILSNARDRQIKALTQYARHLGLAFQIADDILDVVSEEKTLGKPAGADQKAKKATYPGLLGLKRAQKLADRHFRDAVQALKPFGRRAGELVEIAEFAVRRKK
ncbi:polyprenyl synthetase family protein [Candidatus Saganbacteria bacterium]|nr:polyprenyl synthetase family protein [Candidatus Saganbacteria bacterium]